MAWVCVCCGIIHKQEVLYLDERQRLLSAADQCRFLLLLLLHDGSKGWEGGAAHCSHHPGPKGRDGWCNEGENRRMAVLWLLSRVCPRGFNEPVGSFHLCLWTAHFPYLYHTVRIQSELQSRHSSYSIVKSSLIQGRLPSLFQIILTEEELWEFRWNSNRSVFFHF